MAINAKESAAGMDQWTPGGFRFVSDLAFMHEAEWLQVSFRLPQRSCGYERDYLLSIAAKNFDEVVYRRAEYTVAVGHSRSCCWAVPCRDEVGRMRLSAQTARGRCCAILVLRQAAACEFVPTSRFPTTFWSVSNPFGALSG